MSFAAGIARLLPGSARVLMANRDHFAHRLGCRSCDEEFPGENGSHDSLDYSLHLTRSPRLVFLAFLSPYSDFQLLVAA